MCKYCDTGDIDPSIVPYLIHKGMGVQEVEVMMNKKSGFLGMTGEVDVRMVSEKANAGDGDAALALNVFVSRIRNYLGAYLLKLNGNIDAIVFSAGIGEHSPEIRARICEGLEWAGIALDNDKNRHVPPGEAWAVHAKESRVHVLVIPTDEELSIAEQTLELIL